MSKSTPMTAEGIQAWLTTRLAAQLGIDPEDIEPEETFESYGLESARALVILRGLEDLVGRRLSPTLIWNYPTIAQLSQRLAEG